MLQVEEVTLVCTVTLGGPDDMMPGTGCITGDLVTVAGAALTMGEAGDLGLWPVCMIPVVGDNMGMPPLSCRDLLFSVIWDLARESRYLF